MKDHSRHHFPPGPCTHLLGDGKTDALALGEGHKRLLARANDKHVGQTGGKLVANGVLDVDNVHGTHVLLCRKATRKGVRKVLSLAAGAALPGQLGSGHRPEAQRTTVDEGAHTAHVTATSAEHKDASVELDKLVHAASFKVDAHSVVHLDVGVGVTDGAAVVRHNVRDALGANLGADHLAELVLCNWEQNSVSGCSGRGEICKTFGGNVRSSTLDSSVLILWTV